MSAKRQSASEPKLAISYEEDHKNDGAASTKKDKSVVTVFEGHTKVFKYYVNRDFEQSSEASHLAPGFISHKPVQVPKNDEPSNKSITELHYHGKLDDASFYDTTDEEEWETNYSQTEHSSELTDIDNDSLVSEAAGNTGDEDPDEKEEGTEYSTSDESSLEDVSEEGIGSDTKDNIMKGVQQDGSVVHVTIPGDSEEQEEIAVYIEPELPPEALPWESHEHFSRRFEEIFQLPKTGVWSQYHVNPEEILPPRDPKSFEEIISRETLERFCEVERRIQIGSLNFKISRPPGFNGSLFKALSVAFTGHEYQHKIIEKQVFREIESNWFNYVDQIAEFCGFGVLLGASNRKPSSYLTKFKQRFLVSPSGTPEFILKAASSVYHFDYVLVDLQRYGHAVVTTSQPYRKQTPLLYFLRTGVVRESWAYHLLTPLIRSQNSLGAGEYAARIFDAVRIDNQNTSKPKGENASWKRGVVDQGSMPEPPLCVGLGPKTYFYLPTETHDLWSILSELLFHKISVAPQIYELSLRLKYDESNYYHYSKWRKRQMIKGHGLDPKLRQRYRQSLKVPHGHTGNSQDLERASEAMKFSYIMIGLDSKGNCFWKQCSRTPDNPADAYPHLALFMKLLKNGQTEWYALQESQANTPEEEDVPFVDANNSYWSQPGPNIVFPLFADKLSSKGGEKFQFQSLMQTNPTGETVKRSLLGKISNLVTLFGRKLRVFPNPENRPTLNENP